MEIIGQKFIEGLALGAQITGAAFVVFCGLIIAAIPARLMTGKKVDRDE